jgi:hypothetical protein
MFTTVISSRHAGLSPPGLRQRSRQDSVAGHRKIAHDVRERDADQALSTAAREPRCLS